MVSDNIDFEKAVDLSNNEFSYGELISFLKKDSLSEKQFAALTLEEIKSEQDGILFCSNLTGQNGKVREAVSFKLSEFFKSEEITKYLENETNFKIMLDGLMDINGNVCRNILEIDNEKFNKYLADNLIPRINIILEDISKLNIDDKQYVISKRNFQLYWALESLFKIKNLMDFNKIKEILYKTSEFEDYTIREKTAKIVSYYQNNDAKKIKNILKNDENYFVKRYIK